MVFLDVAAEGGEPKTGRMLLRYRRADRAILKEHALGKNTTENKEAVRHERGKAENTQAPANQDLLGGRRTEKAKKSRRRQQQRQEQQQHQVQLPASCSPNQTMACYNRTAHAERCFQSSRPRHHSEHQNTRRKHCGSWPHPFTPFQGPCSSPDELLRLTLWTSNCGASASRSCASL